VSLALRKLSRPKCRSVTILLAFVASDFPEILPGYDKSKVAFVAEESVHYSIDGPDANEEWAVMKVNGNGFMTAGLQERAFALSMFHESHCLRLMRYALSGKYDPEAMGHMNHCLNYLRQEILCAADLTLEPADVLERDFDITRTGATYVCPDWRELYRAVDESKSRLAQLNQQ
jgi:hypothetical protein